MVVESGGWITYDDQLAKYAIHDASGELHGYRRSLDAARELAENIKSRPPRQEQPE